MICTLIYTFFILQIDLNLVPFKSAGPTATPAPSASFDAPDGDYSDISPKWD